MSTVSLNNSSRQIINGNDGIVVRHVTHDIPGGRSLDVTGFAPKVIREGHVIIKENSTGTHKPMPATELQKDGVATLGSITAGTGYTNGTYENVPLSGGSGKGVLATVTVASTVVSAVVITQKGEGYKVGDVLGIPGSYAGGTGSGASVPVATISDTAAAYGSLPSGHSYAGINVATILTEKAFAGIMVGGQVNDQAAPFPMSSILSAVKTALPLIDFRGD